MADSEPPTCPRCGDTYSPGVNDRGFPIWKCVRCGTVTVRVPAF